MKKILILAATALTAFACSKEPQKLPLPDDVYVKTGEQWEHKWDEKMFGVTIPHDRTETLITHFAFVKGGTGYRYVYYIESNVLIGYEGQASYGIIGFTWEYSGGTLTITNTEHDPVIPDVTTISDITENPTEAGVWIGSYNGAYKYFYTDPGDVGLEY